MKIDTATKSVTIRNKKDGAMVVIVMEDAAAAMLSKVEEGNKAEAKYIIKDGVNIGIKLRKMGEGC
jgi:hypothetical protein